MPAIAAVRPAPSSSMREVRKRLRHARQRTSTPITLYYGSLEDDDVFRCEAFGRRITIMPDAFVSSGELGGEHVRHDGTIVIRDVMGAGRWSRDKAVQKHMEKSVLIHAAEDVAFQVMRRGQERGLTQLTGDEAQDLVLKREATARWVAWRRASAARTIVAYRKECEGLRREGLSPREMDYREMLAQRFLEDDASGVYRAYMEVVSPFKYHCQEPNCGRPEKDAERFLRHLKFTHQLTPEAIMERYGSDVEDAETAKSAGRRRKPAPAEGPGASDDEDVRMPPAERLSARATARLQALQPDRSIRPSRDRKSG